MRQRLFALLRRSQVIWSFETGGSASPNHPLRTHGSVVVEMIVIRAAVTFVGGGATLIDELVDAFVFSDVSFGRPKQINQGVKPNNVGR